jgi:hypothetical protein
MLSQFYKAKRKSDGAYIYGYSFVSFEFGTFLLPSDDTISWNDIKLMLEGLFDEYKVDKQSIQDCTFHGDKSGVYIYNGDTIKIEGKEGLFKIGTWRKDGSTIYVAIDENHSKRYPLETFKKSQLEIVEG